jgi:caspase domain-containing protein
MPLLADPNEKGLWINPNPPPGGAGVFALVIGVSRYDHLTGGISPAPDTYGLGQLAVSALTAYRLFEWLSDGYALTGWPVATARLLLSPVRKGIAGATADELAGCDPAICDHAVEATFANCQAAVERWYADMQAIAPAAAGRSLFFFSGHGLELKQSHQVLLPSNYLRPPNQPINEAISTRNLIDCLPYLPRIGSHVLLMDACRNDFDRLRGRKVEGFDILNEGAPGTENAIYDKGVLYSTASGQQAYQPQSPSKGLSLFGQALLDGLKTKPVPVLDEAPIELRSRGDLRIVEINGLTSYIKGRIAALIKAAKESVVQVVRSEVSSSDPGRPIELAEIRHAATVLEGVTLPISEVVDGLPGLETFEAVRSDKRRPLTPEPRPRRVPVKEREAWLARRYSIERKPGALLTAGATKDQHFGRLHGVLGSEAVTDPWLDSLRIAGLATRASADHMAVPIVSARQDRETRLHRVQIHFQLTRRDPVGHLLTIEDGYRRRFGCVLPHDLQRPTYQLEIDVGDGETGPNSFIRFAAYLSAQSGGLPGKAAMIWERLRALNPTAATPLVERSEGVLAEKVQSPLAATIAGVVLLNAGRLDLMHDWVRNVGNWYSWIPDGVVLWTEQCRREPARQRLYPAVIPWFAQELAKRSLPFTADGFGFAANIVRDVQRGRVKTDRATRRLVDALGERIDRVMPYFRDEGLFCSYRAWPDDLALLDAIGPPRSDTRRRRPAPTRKRKPSPKKRPAARSKRKLSTRKPSGSKRGR